jgi:hypothetical protein
MPRSRSRGRRERETPAIGVDPALVASIALGLLVVIAPQLLGGVFGWGMSIIATLAGVAVILAAWSARRASFGTLVLVALVVLAWTAVQALPLPRMITGWLQPDALTMADDAARLLGDPAPSWVALSLSPASTRAEIVKGCAMVAAFVAAWLLAVQGRRRAVLVAVAVSITAVAFSALAHLGADAQTVYGLYGPIVTGTPIPAPILNQNHLAGFLSMGVPVIVALGLEAEERGAKVVWLTLAALVSAVTLLAMSRGGVVSLVFGLLCLGALGLLRRRRGQRLAGPLALVGIALLTVLALGVYLAGEAIYRDFASGDLSKLDLAGRGAVLALEHPWIGVGRGAFSAAFVRDHGAIVRYTHPENFLAQWASEWGLVVAIGLLVAIGTAALSALGSLRSWARAGALAGLVAIAVHDLVDFALELSGVSVVAAALAGAALASRPRAKISERRSEQTRAPRIVAAGTGVAALASVVLFGISIDGESAYALERQLTEELRAGRYPRETLALAVRRHPSEPVFMLLGGAFAIERRDPKAILWLNLAMERAPQWSSPHEEAARYFLLADRHDQAFIEMRAAEERRQGGTVLLAARALRERPEQADAFVRAARRDAVGVHYLDQTAHYLPLDSAAGSVIDRALASRRDLLGPRTRAARRALSDRDPERALRELAPLGAQRDTDLVLLRAEAERAAGRPARAARLLRGAERWSERPEAVLDARAEALAAAGDDDGMRAVADELRRRAAGSSVRLARVWILQGRLEHQLGNDGRAMQAFEQANDLEPASGGLHQVAQLAEHLGSYRRSYQAYATLCRNGPPSSPHCAARDRLRERLGEP